MRSDTCRPHHNATESTRETHGPYQCRFGQQVRAEDGSDHCRTKQAGKTTFATQFLPNEGNCPALVNADLIAADLNPFQPKRDALDAGRMMLRAMLRYVEQGESFAFQTTLSSRGYMRLIPELQGQGAPGRSRCT